MTFLSARRLVPACVVAGAAIAALAAPGAASASDLGTQCSGGNIEGMGSSFQNPAQKVWETGSLVGFNASANLFACAGKEGQGTKATPSVKYNQEETPINNKGSGACLKELGAGLGKTETTRKAQFPFCGTDEAPNATQKKEIEEHLTGGEERNVLSVPVTQGAVAVIVNLPTGCKAQSEVKSGEKTLKLGRLALDATTLEEIYKGGITTWAGVEAAQGAGHANDKITCTEEAAKNDTINVVVRLDKSGTTHIFKSYLAQINTAAIPMEAFNEPEGGGKKPCGEAKAEESKTWKNVQEGCENQRWPTAAKVVRPAKTGNPAVIQTVAATPSSIGYGDLSVVREEKSFSAKGQGGENKKGSETKLGEQNQRFWVELQNNPGSGTPTYVDAASNADVEKAANSNCSKELYIGGEKEEKVPPASTRELWSSVKASATQIKYPICGLTYDIAFRQYFPAELPEGLTEAQSLERAQTVHDYLLWVLSSKTGGGGNVLKNHDYEKLPSAMQKIAEAGVKEIGNVKA
jgi:ABC-type phosphate transport system substrate-binding protein